MISSESRQARKSREITRDRRKVVTMTKRLFALWLNALLPWELALQRFRPDERAILGGPETFVNYLSAFKITFEYQISRR